MDNLKNDFGLNDEQKAAAFCGENAVVSAGAGSGKTRVLASRFSYLITEKGFKIEEILTLTFTKKAAAQMFGRIHSQLTEIAKNETGIKASRAKAALDNFVKARIQTLDSYSAAILKQAAPRYGITPDFIIDQERCTKIALEEALPFLITHRHNAAVERLYSNYRPNDIARKIFAEVLVNHCQIDSPRNFLSDVKKQFNIIHAEWEKSCGNILTLLKETENLIFEDNALLPDLVPLMTQYRKEKIFFPESSQIREYFDLLLEIHPESCVEKAESHPLQKQIFSIVFFISQLNALSHAKGKRKDNQVKENLKQIRELFTTFSSVAVFCMQAGFVISIMDLLSQLQSRYLHRKRTEGVLTFKDIALLSRTILIEQQDIRQSEKESFKAIMIDEFQDNNELQKDLLFLLAEKLEILNNGVPSPNDLCPDKLFFVGDEKQSVYLFRGADVSVFRRLKEEIKSKNLPLKINYRSSHELIGAFNAIFGGSVFDPQGKSPHKEFPSVFAPDNFLPLYEASYTPLEANNNNDGNLSICILNKSGDDSNDEEELLASDENEAFFAAKKIRALLDEKKYTEKDIAILFRSRSSQYLFEKHLRNFDIPYTCEDINDFFYGGLVNDIMSVLRLVSYPLDSASYAEMLRSPFAGLSITGTAECLSVFRESEKPQVFNDAPLKYLDETDKEKYKHGQKIYMSICEKAEKENIASLVSELWYNEGYRYETEWSPAVGVYREFYDYLFHLAVKADSENVSLASFTDSMREFRDSGGNLSEIEIPLERPRAVHLMTIHKSKGLEFPVVFLCGCGKHSRQDTSGEVFFSDEAGLFITPPKPKICYSILKLKNNFFHEQAASLAKQKRTAELRRLLYVGMTRAEKELFITGSLNIKESGEKAGDPETKEDFSLKIKSYTEKKLEKNKNLISGDSILDNDTFFGLLLPSIAAHIPLDGLNKTPSFFNLEEIPSLTEKDLNAKNSKEQESLSDYLKRTESLYGNAEIITTPVLRKNHITPVSLRNKNENANLAGGKIPAAAELAGESSDDVFEKVDFLLNKFSQAGALTSGDMDAKFNSADFGTIAHICAEALLNGKEAEIPPDLSARLTPSEAETLLDAGNELAIRFVRSPLGKTAKNARIRENEYPFRTIVKNQNGEEIFINGEIDLLFADDSSIHVVDFKTDSREMPEEHIPQMACYFRAMSDLFASPQKKDCRVWLYYLRTGRVVEVTEQAKLFPLEEAAFV